VFCIIVKRYNNKAKVVTHIIIKFRGRVIPISFFIHIRFTLTLGLINHSDQYNQFTIRVGWGNYGV
jgi:hypothetical protein